MADDVIPNASDSCKRQARCPYCYKLEASNPNLPFFEDRSPASKVAQRCCKVCRCYPEAHEPSKRPTPTGYPSIIGKPHPFTPQAEYEFDSYYCGCRGWD